MRHPAPTRHPWATLLAVLLAVLPAVAAPAPAAARQASETAAAEIGAPPILEQAWSFVGRTAATGDQMTVAGRLIAVSGLPPNLLIVGGDEEAARGSRFTFVAEVTSPATSSRGNIVTTTGDGLLTIYLHDEQAYDANDLESLRAGIVVAELEVTFQGTAQDPAPEQGVVAGRMTLTQTESFTFLLDDERYRFGHAGLELALSYVGGVAAGDDDAGATTSVFGAAAVGRRAANPVDTGEASAAVLSECDLLLAWVEPTSDRLARANEIRSTIVNQAEVSVDDLNQAASGIAAVVEEQRSQVAPESASGVERLARAALSTDARGLALLESAVEAGDEPAAAAARAILADGAALTSRALLTLEELTPTCDPAS
ncbi:MAG: hypothetical protein M3464_22330 [Chloroflexota bacterium]|nr:hypothetical protein [Chloroflexota bacterium]